MIITLRDDVGIDNTIIIKRKILNHSGSRLNQKEIIEKNEKNKELEKELYRI